MFLSIFLRCCVFSPYLARKSEIWIWGIPESPFYPWPPWYNFRSWWKLSWPFRNTDHWRGKGTCVQNVHWAYTASSQAHFCFSTLVGSQSIHFLLRVAFPTGSQAWQFSRSLSFSPFEHPGFFPNTLILPSLLLLSAVFCLSLAGLPLPDHLPCELFLGPLFFIGQHLSPWHIRTTPSPVLCFSFPPTHWTSVDQQGLSLNWRIFALQNKYCFVSNRKKKSMEKSMGSKSSRTYHAVCFPVGWISYFSSCRDEAHGRVREEVFILVPSVNREGTTSRVPSVYCSGSSRQLADSQEARRVRQKQNQLITFKAHPYGSVLSARPHGQPHLGAKCSNTRACGGHSTFQDRPIRLIIAFISTRQTCQ